MSAMGKKREWVYPAWVRGVFQTRRKWAFAILHIILFVPPWIHIKGQQIVLIDLSKRQLTIAGSIFTPRDTIFLVIGLLFSAFLLFFVTSLWGRIWCGYACPQTVFLESFVHTVERWVEGNRGKRMSLDRADWSANKIARKVAKHTIFIAAAVLIAMTFVSWFAGTIPLWTGQASASAYGMVAFFAGVMYLDFAWFREQFCNYLCPYARFQGVISGPNSLTITYDAARGEPRRERGVKRAKSELGDCIGCNKCVAVCPAGIDIRDGYQLECIGCAKCVDACAPIMAKFGKENLVRYSTVVEDAGGKSKLLRPRPVIYALLMLVLAVAGGSLLVARHSLDVTVNRVPGTLFTIDDDGATRNTFMLSVSNRKFTESAADIEVSVDGIPDVEVIMPPMQVATGEIRQVPLVIRAPAGVELQRTQPIDIRVRSDFDEVVVSSTFKTDARTGG